MMIDLSTIRSLELIQNLQNSKSRDCLFGLLNETLTPMGSRLLRSNILQPLTDPEVLKRRFDALEELTIKEDMFFAIRQGYTNQYHTAFVKPPENLTSEHSIETFSGCRQALDFSKASLILFPPELQGSL